MFCKWCSNCENMVAKTEYYILTENTRPGPWISRIIMVQGLWQALCLRSSKASVSWMSWNGGWGWEIWPPRFPQGWALHFCLEWHQADSPLQTCPAMGSLSVKCAHRNESKTVAGFLRCWPPALWPRRLGCHTPRCCQPAAFFSGLLHCAAVYTGPRQLHSLL